MGLFGRKKKNDEEKEEIVAPKPVMAGDKSGSNIMVGDQDDPNRTVVMKSSYKGMPEKDFKFKIDESMLSVIYTDDTGYIDEYITGSVQPSKYWDKKFLGLKPKEVSVLSFSDNAFTIATSVTVRVPGGDLDGTVRGSFRFVPGNPRAIASLLLSTYAKENVNLDVKRKYITAEALEIMIRTEFQDIIRTPLFVETIYENVDDLQDQIFQKIKDDPYFLERSLDITSVRIRFDRTEIEKLKDEEEKHKILIREMEMEKEIRDAAINLAVSESEEVKKI